MEAKLGSTINIPFVVSDPSTGLPSDGTGVAVAIYEAGSGTAEAYAPVVVNRSADGNFSATIAVTGTNGFSTGIFYEAWASVSFGTASYTAPICAFKVLTFDFDSNMQSVSSITYKTSGNGLGKIDVITLADSTTLTHTYNANHQLTSVAVA